MRKLILTFFCFWGCITSNAQERAEPVIGLDSLNKLLMSRVKFPNDFINSRKTTEVAFNIQLDSNGRIKNLIGKAKINDTLNSKLLEQIAPILQTLEWNRTIPEGYIYFEFKFSDKTTPPPKRFKNSDTIVTSAKGFKIPRTEPYIPEITQPDINNDHPIKPEVEATFEGGMVKFRDYVREHLNYPERCLEEGINGSVLLEFVVDTHGKISNIKMLKETAACPEFTSECIRILTESPRWYPGTIDGKPVKSYRTIPIQMTVGN